MGLLRPDLLPVLPGEGREGRQVGLGVDQHLGDSEGNGSFRESMTCLYWAATVLGLVPLRLLVRCGVRDVALRADHGGGLGVDQVLQPGLEQTPEDLVVSKIGVGKDFPDQRGHGRLVTGHRGCAP